MHFTTKITILITDGRHKHRFRNSFRNEKKNWIYFSISILIINHEILFREKNANNTKVTIIFFARACTLVILINWPWTIIYLRMAANLRVPGRGWSTIPICVLREPGCTCVPFRAVMQFTHNAPARSYRGHNASRRCTCDFRFLQLRKNVG